MINKKFFLLLWISVTGLAVSAQEVYDLNRCITTGLENNFAIRIAQSNAEIAANNRTPGNAGFLPSVDLTGRYGGTINNTSQTYSSGYDTSFNGVHNTTSTAGVALGWDIFRGFSAQTTWKKLNELKLAGELNSRMTVEDFVADMASEYNYYIQQLQLYHNLAYAVSLSRERVRIDEERYLLGAASKLQLLQSQVYLNSDSSRYARQLEVLRASQVRINRLMASGNLGGHIILKDSTIRIHTTLVYDSLLAATLKENTSLLIARKNQTVSEYDYRLIAARTYPYLSLSTGYNFNYYNYESGSFKSQQVDGLNYGLTLGVNLFDGLNQRREKANARIAIDNRTLQYEQIAQQVEADLITIFYAYQNNLMLLKLEAQNLKTAEENLEIALERYKLGSLSGLELREVQQSLLEAEERLLSVQYQTKLAEISLLQISGKIMEYLQVG
ncbi:MAG: TolC family protein [Bacteroidales bacterium]|nr:TolC family protein [Bacteroidales bacterium]